jgi:hypothetical protein
LKKSGERLKGKGEREENSFNLYPLPFTLKRAKVSFARGLVTIKGKNGLCHD